MFVSFSAVQDGIYELGKAHIMRPTPSIRSFPNVLFETVPMFVWLTMALSRPFKEDRLALPISTLLSSRRSMVWCPCPQVVSQIPQHFRSSVKLVICGGCFARRSLCSAIILQSLRHAHCSTPTADRSFLRWLSTIDTFHFVSLVVLFFFLSLSLPPLSHITTASVLFCFVLFFRTRTQRRPGVHYSQDFQLWDVPRKVSNE